MARDYAKQSLAKGKKKRRVKSDRHLGLLFFTLILIAAFIIALVYLAQQRMAHHRLLDAAIKKKPALETAKPIAKQNGDAQDIKFDFYTILPKMKVNPDKDN